MRPQTTSGFCSEVFRSTLLAPLFSPQVLCSPESHYHALCCLFHGHSPVSLFSATKGFLETWIKQGFLSANLANYPPCKHATVKASFSAILPLSFNDQLFRSVACLWTVLKRLTQWVYKQCLHNLIWKLELFATALNRGKY